MCLHNQEMACLSDDGLFICYSENSAAGKLGIKELVGRKTESSNRNTESAVKQTETSPRERNHLINEN